MKKKFVSPNQYVFLEGRMLVDGMVDMHEVID